MAKKKRGTANPATARPIMRGATVASRGGSPRVGPFKAKKSGFTQTAGYWTDTKPVTIREQYQKAPSAGRIENLNRKPKVSKGASAGRIEHLHRKPKYGQPQYSSNITSGAAKNTKLIAASIAQAAAAAQRQRRRR